MDGREEAMTCVCLPCVEEKIRALTCTTARVSRVFALLMRQLVAFFFSFRGDVAVGGGGGGARGGAGPGGDLRALARLVSGSGGGGGQWELTGRAVTTDLDPDVDGLSGRRQRQCFAA